MSLEFHAVQIRFLSLEFPSHEFRVTVGEPRLQPILQPPCLCYGFLGLALGHIGEACVEPAVTECRNVV